ncbi:MAG: bifunctional demethylmenaquinone methyltransferase/2-methoxy-6-polyprenyl-1,4-benzoquinol methylase UbiE [Cytophagales bacterium]|nr:bifunctional demethylmenaquinone methyltransferase/2-methoxy-6-polyprenyl-1,4-benzoquinol methylase UbiE [Bernardetiaceae bacterium]MDW8204217.1 bifunctional demethylmenaquinone methyltransferase/2-methoxy-6-polyprenyl-1,4-benzoquinol methylase UbiE [Cytophagales bacterium]
MTVVPYKNRPESKKTQVADMFDNISPRYDLLNRLLSGGVDIYWRKRAVGKLAPARPKLILDIATGTAELAIEALSLQPEKVIGVDISEGMLAFGRQKLAKMGLQGKIELQKGDSEALAFADNTFDAAMVAFGVRNFENLDKGLADIYRVLKPGGMLVVLEFSQPSVFPIKQLYNFYSRYILPRIGKAISKDAAAYDYLPESVREFPYGAVFLQHMHKAGFAETQCEPLTFGICSIYTGKKSTIL